MGGSATQYVQAWDGSAWSPLGSGTNGYVYAMATADTALMVGGAFSQAGGKPASNLARWARQYAVVPVPSGGSVQSAATLHPGAPNPFSASTAIRFYLPSAASVTLDIYDVRGRRVASLVDGVIPKGGHYTVTWNGRSGEGRALASGVYICRLRVGAVTRAVKLVHKM